MHFLAAPLLKHALIIFYFDDLCFGFFFAARRSNEALPSLLVACLLYTRAFDKVLAHGIVLFR